jgi:putative peptidoglycan lipid II flippase
MEPGDTGSLPTPEADVTTEPDAPTELDVPTEPEPIDPDAPVAPNAQPAPNATDAPTPPSRARSIGRATLLMASGTLVSRILGMVKMLLLGYLIGIASRQADIYSVANTVPMSVYVLIAGGVLNAILVPQLVRAQQEDEDKGQALTNRLFTAFLLILALMTILLMVGGRLVAWLYSSSEWHTPALAPHFDSLVFMTILVMPQLFFYGVFAFLGQVLNANGSFGPMMWAPVVNNVVQIALFAFYATVYGFGSDWSQPFSTAQALILGGATLIGVVAQAAVLIPALRHIGFHYRPRFDFLHTGLGHFAGLAKWVIVVVIITEGAAWFVTRLATIATAGGEGAGNSAYTNAYIIFMVPHSLLTVSLVTALIPTLAADSSAGRWGSFAHSVTSGIRSLCAATVPLSFLLVAVGVPLCEMAYRGKVGGTYVGWTLVALALGIVPMTVQYVTQRSFYAKEDPRAAAASQAIQMGVTLAVDFILVLGVKVSPAWVAPALGIGLGAGYLVSAIATLGMLRRSVPQWKKESLLRPIVLQCLAALPGSLIAAVICFYQKAHFVGLIPDIIGLVIAVLVAGGVYLGVAKLAHIEGVDELLAMVHRRGARRG